MPADSPALLERREQERRLGIYHVASRSAALDVATQVIDLSSLDPRHFDPRLGDVDAAALHNSRAIIVNIDYPLGLAAYNILREIAETAGHLRGVYILAKAPPPTPDARDRRRTNV